MADSVFPHKFQAEIIDWHNGYIKVHDKFRPHFGSTLITEKFYSKYEAISDQATKKPNVEDYGREVGRRQMSGPREIYDGPMTEGQAYGWLLDKVLVYEDEIDRELFHRGKSVDPYMKIKMDINLGLKRDRKCHMLR